MNMFEQVLGPEQSKVERNDVIEALRNKGKEDPEVKEILATFVAQNEAIVEKSEGKQESFGADLVFQFDIVKIFYEAGLSREAYDLMNGTKEGNYEDGLLEYARQARKEELFDETLALTEKIEAELGL